MFASTLTHSSSSSLVPASLPAAATPLPSSALLEQTAYHEAGHAAAVVFSQGAYHLRGLSLRPPANRCGDHVPERYRHSGAHLTIDPSIRLRELGMPERRGHAEALVVVVLSGVVAEAMCLRQPPCEHSFRQELAAHGLYALLHVHGGACLPEYRRWLQARATHLVAIHWRGISRLAAALREHQELSGQEVARFLQSQS